MRPSAASVRALPAGLGERANLSRNDAAKQERARLGAQHAEPLPLGRERQAIIEADEVERARIALGGDDSGRKLEGVARAQVVHAEQPPRHASQLLRGHDLLPLLGVISEILERGLRLRGSERAVPLPPSDGGRALHHGRPPNDDKRVTLRKTCGTLPAWLLDEKR